MVLRTQNGHERQRRAMIVGYARTSTTDQAAGLAAQERDLKAADAERIFGEQVSSSAKRAKPCRVLTFLREGDVLTWEREIMLERQPSVSKDAGSSQQHRRSSFPVRLARLLSRPDLAVPRARRATKEMGGAEPPGATRSAPRRASMARMASTGPSPK